MGPGMSQLSGERSDFYTFGPYFISKLAQKYFLFVFFIFNINYALFPMHKSDFGPNQEIRVNRGNLIFFFNFLFNNTIENLTL